MKDARLQLQDLLDSLAAVHAAASAACNKDLVDCLTGPAEAAEALLDAGAALGLGSAEQLLHLKAGFRPMRVAPRGACPCSDTYSNLQWRCLDWRSREWQTAAAQAPSWLSGARGLARFHVIGDMGCLQLIAPRLNRWTDRIEQPQFRVHVDDRLYSLTVPGSAFRTAAAIGLAEDQLAQTREHAGDAWIRNLLTRSLVDLVMRRRRPRCVANTLVERLAPGHRITFRHGGVTGAVLAALEEAMYPQF